MLKAYKKDIYGNVKELISDNKGTHRTIKVIFNSL